MLTCMSDMNYDIRILFFLLTYLLTMYIMTIICMSDVNYDMRAGGVVVSAAGTALKQFFSELREPVIPLRFYEDLKDAVSKFSHWLLQITRSTMFC